MKTAKKQNPKFFVNEEEFTTLAKASAMVEKLKKQLTKKIEFINVKQKKQIVYTHDRKNYHISTAVYAPKTSHQSVENIGNSTSGSDNLPNMRKTDVKD